jgi:hypothetical protein
MTMTSFDYAAPAELFLSKSAGASRRPMQYRRFATGAEAIRFAMEQLPAATLTGTVLEVDDVRFGHLDIRKLYEEVNYPLTRSSCGAKAEPILALK